MSNPMSYPKFKAFHPTTKDYLVGGKLYSYYPGTSTVKPTYTDHTRANANYNPTILDDYGEATVYTIGPTKFVLTDANDVSIWTQDWVGDGYQGMYDAGTAGTLSALTAILTTIGTTNPAKLYLGPVTWTITADLTFPANVTLVPDPMAKLLVSSTKTLKINGPIEAGPTQEIFQWTGSGAIDLSDCPNYEYPLEWMGGLPDGTDVASSLNKYVDAFGGSRKAVKLGCGTYSLKTPVVVDTLVGSYGSECLNILGHNFQDSKLYINVGANVGITIGVDEDGGDPGTYVPDLVMKNFTICGPANACTTALKLAQVGNIDLDLNFWIGSTDFACIIGNCDWAKARLYLCKGRYVPDVGALTLAEPAKGILLTNGEGANINGNNASEFYINGESVGTNPQLEVSPKYVTGGASGETMTITGSFENWTTSPIIINGVGALNAVYQRGWLIFKNIHIENGTPGGTIPISNISDITFEGFENAVESCPVVMSNTKNVTWNNYFLRGGITIAPDCQGTILFPGVTEGAVLDYAGDTLYFNGPNKNQAYNAEIIAATGHDPTNYMYNVGMNRWQTSIMAGGWAVDANTTYAVESSIVHILPNSAKFVYTDTAPTHVGYTYCNFDAYQLRQFKGKNITFSAFLQLKAGDIYTTYPIITISFACPARVNSTAYYLGQGVTDGSGNHYICVAVTGNQKSGAAPPTWITTDGALTVDGNVTWRVGMTYGNTNLGDNYNEVVGSFYKLMTGAFCPTNVDSGYVVVAQYPQTGGAVGTLYLAEPALMVGRQSPRSYVANHPNEVLIGSCKQTADTVIPTNGSSNITGLWSCKGDICINQAVTATGTPPFWICTTAGVNGSGAAWTAAPNLA